MKFEIGGESTSLVRRSILGALLVGLLGCDDKALEHVVEDSLKRDMEGLRKFIRVPAGVLGCEWQTGARAKHGGDWWLAAVLDFASERRSDFLQGNAVEEFLELPANLILEGALAQLRTELKTSLGTAGAQGYVTRVYPVDPYVKSPLLNGRATVLAPNQLFLILWTN